ncbi:WD40-repeat-containing domain protein [Protomyces lactucae-debilis]|uniref:WD40-repeat-containing domain protein n=1 Tax=Protomyces lactucae-debilis TaxID=2754530 RepID=A0A1Y2FLN0_PROLT|nr:WD40-repeat-containing domain protein [Protomyces lactucae-debilis]ORY84264.1 WD40-repeat-containing domain protein [Protomyces lactucae-debilis]
MATARQAAAAATASAQVGQLAQDTGAAKDFLATAVPSEVSRRVRQGVRSGNGFCYRHNPQNTQCRSKEANEPLMGDIQKQLDHLPAAKKEGISQIWSFFSAASQSERKLILQGLLTQCCFPQLSYIASCTRDLIRIDYITALPTEVGFKILSYLDASSLCKAAQVSKHWADLANDDVVWHRMCEQHIDRKCTKCGWGLPLLERKRLRATKQKIQQRAEEIAARDEQVTGEKRLAESTDSERPAKLLKCQVESPVEIPVSLPQLTRPWKAIYCERQKVESNWRRGRCQQRTLRGHTDGVMCVQADDSIIASGSYDGSIKIWDLTSGELLRTLDGHTRGVNCLQFDDAKLISGSMDKTLKIWNYRTGECLSTLRGHTEGVLSLHFDKTVLASGSADNTIRVWNFSDGTCTVLRGHRGWVNAVRVHSACQRLFSASDDTTIKMWNLDTRQCIRTLEGHVGQVQAISPVLESLDAEEDDPYGVRQRCTPREYYSSSLDGTVKSWDVETGLCTRTLFGHVEGVWCLSADTLRLVTGAHDKTVKVWDCNDGKCILSLAGHSGPVNCVHVGDARIVSGGDDGQVRIWDFSA